VHAAFAVDDRLCLQEVCSHNMTLFARDLNVFLGAHHAPRHVPSRCDRNDVTDVRALTFLSPYEAHVALAYDDEKHGGNT
jgi:hypothetical protein